MTLHLSLFRSIGLLAVLAGTLGLSSSLAQQPGSSVPVDDIVSYTASYGPYNGIFIAGGPGLSKRIPERDTVLKASAAWTLSCWVKPTIAPEGPTLIAGLGNPIEEDSRYFALLDGKLAFRLSEDNALKTSTTLSLNQWHFLTATFDGSVIRLYSDGVEIVDGKLLYATVSPVIELAPAYSTWPPAPSSTPKITPWFHEPVPVGPHFSGIIAAFTVERATLDEKAVAALFHQKPDFAAIDYEEGSKPWPTADTSAGGLSRATGSFDHADLCSTLFDAGRCATASIENHPRARRR